MYSLPITSSMLERVSRKSEAAKYQPSATAGMIRCCQPPWPLVGSQPSHGLGHHRHRIAGQPDHGEDGQAEDEQGDDGVQRSANDEPAHENPRSSPRSKLAQAFSSMSSQG